MIVKEVSGGNVNMYAQMQNEKKAAERVHNAGVEYENKNEVSGKVTQLVRLLE